MESEKIEERLDDTNHLKLWAHILKNSCEVNKSPNYTLLSTGINFALNNGVYHAHFSSDLVDANIKEIKQYFQQKQLPFIWIVNSSTTPLNLEQKLLNYGFSELFRESGMVFPVSKKNPNRKKIEKSVIIREVNCSEDSHIFEQVSIDGFGLPSKIISGFYNKYPLNSPTLRRIITFYKNKPIGVGMVLLENGYGVLHNIAVLPEYRRLGIGTQITQNLIDYVRNAGYFHVILHASNDGEALYQRIGFSKVNQQTVFIYNG